MGEVSLWTMTKDNGLSIVKRKVRTTKKLIARGFYRICTGSDVTWRYVANTKPWIEYQRIKKPLSGAQTRILTELKHRGIAIGSVSELAGGNDLFVEMEKAVQHVEISMADEIRMARASAGAKNGAVKNYALYLLGRRLILDPTSIFVRFAVQPDILAIANHYFGMLTKLTYYNLWHNFPMNEEPKESQLWHRDPEDRYILKVFVYLTDVGEGAGPLSYAPGTHCGGNVRIKPDSIRVKEGNTYVHRINDSQMAAAIAKERWITAVGLKGTVVFVDTRGYHKGGYCREHDRILYNCMFNSQASSYPDIFDKRLPLTAGMDEATTFALGHPQTGVR
jgi:hypothetical protein